MTKKTLAEEVVDAIGAGANALLASDAPTKPLAEMPETPLLVLPKGRKTTATARHNRRSVADA